MLNIYFNVYRLSLILCIMYFWLNLSYVDRVHFRERCRNLGVNVNTMLKNYVSEIVYDKLRLYIIRPLCVVMESFVGFLEGVENLEAIINISDNESPINKRNIEDKEIDNEVIDNKEIEENNTLKDISNISEFSISDDDISKNILRKTKNDDIDKNNNNNVNNVNNSETENIDTEKDSDNESIDENSSDELIETNSNNIIDDGTDEYSDSNINIKENKKVNINPRRNIKVKLARRRYNN